MPNIALVSPCGGTGRSTLTATLTALVSRSNGWSLAVECDPQNLLALHFGAEQAVDEGLASQALRGQAWNAAALVARDGSLVLPFGPLAPLALIDWERRLVVEPDWLWAHLDRLVRPPGAWVFIDTPRTPSVLARQAARAADAVLLVLRADGAALGLLDTALDALDAKITLAVVNSYDPALALQSEVVAALYERLGERLSPHLIHRDEALPEAFAQRRFPGDYAPHAQAMQDIHGLLRWIRQRCASMSPTAGPTAGRTLG